jgi:formylmethanofuran dehydrogenase subunit E
MKRPAPQSLTDLRPNVTIRCLQCEQPRAAAGAVKFHGHHVCAACADKLRVKPLA